MKTIDELSAFWNKEKESYKDREIGSGVQSFVYEVFRCEELFDLEDGLKSTPDKDRCNQFLREERNTAGVADAVIFIDSDIIIPVEVEKFGHAQKGEWQVTKYRRAYDKKYGILTDGYEWRFYYGEIEDEKYYGFDLDTILKEPKKFLTFWNVKWTPRIGQLAKVY